MDVNQIFNEDCLITMNKLPQSSVDLVITSPPYNMTKRKGGYADKGKRYDVYQDWKTEDEYLEWMKLIFDGYDRILKKNGSVIFNFSYSIENPILPYHLISYLGKNTTFTVVDTIIWKKPTAVPHPASYNRCRRIFEMIFIFSRKTEMDTFFMRKEYTVGKNGQKYYGVVDNFIQAPNNDESTTLNKATFSSSLVRQLLKMYGPEGGIVYDSFMGTGTTAKGAKLEGMNYWGSEISKDQCDWALNRLSKI